MAEESNPEEKKALAIMGLVPVAPKELSVLKKLGGEYAPDVPISYKLLHGELALNRMAMTRLVQVVMNRLEESDDDDFILAATRALPKVQKEITESVRVAAERFEAADSLKALKDKKGARAARVTAFPSGPLVVQQITVESKPDPTNEAKEVKELTNTEHEVGRTTAQNGIVTIADTDFPK